MSPERGAVNTGYVTVLWLRMIVGFSGCACALPLMAGGLPAFPSGWEAARDEPLFLELLINQVSTGKVINVRQQAGKLYIPVADLQDARVTLPAGLPLEVTADSVPGLRVDYDSPGQRLWVDVPPGWLPRQQSGRASTGQPPALGSLGGLLNYDLYLNDSDNSDTYLAAWNEARLFDHWGTLSNTGQYRRTLGAQSASDLNNGYRRYDTLWRYSDDAQLLTYEAGDVITGALPWSGAVRLGGVQLSRDFGLRPDLVTYPLPQFSGEAAVPSSVDVFINGFKSSSADLRPGPYTLTNVPFINGAGEAVVVTTDALGRQVSTQVPFYVTSHLLKQGLSDFSVSAGTLRRDYGLRDFSYGPGVVVANGRYGLNDSLTLESHVEAADGLVLGGAGSNLKLGHYGVLNSAVSQSRFKGQTGQQLSLGYQYNTRHASLAYQRIERRAGYADVTVIDSAASSLSKRSEQVILSLNLGTYGSLGAGYFDIRAVDDSRTRLLNLTWSVPLWASSVYLSANRELSTGQWVTQAQVVIPFELGTLALGSERSKAGAYRQQVRFSHAVPSMGGVGYNVGYSLGNGPGYRQADLTWRLQSVQLQAGTYGSNDQSTRWAGASGSLVWMDNRVFAANRVNDAFVVVSTHGFADVAVRYENQLMGQTDETGHLLVTGTNGYYWGKYEIDTLNLPSTVQASQVEQRVAVRRGSGYLVTFALTRVNAVSLALVDVQGKPLAVGSRVRPVPDGASAVVGWEGLVYLENVLKHNTLQVTSADGSACKVQLDLPEETAEVQLIGPLVCQ